MKKLGALLALSLMWSSAVLAQNKNFVSLIGAGYFGQYKDHYSLSSLALNSSVVTLRTRHDLLDQSKVKIFLPPGTISFRTSIVTYRAPQPGKVAARLNNPPTVSAQQIGPAIYGFDSRKTLARLNLGQEVSVYSPEESGVLVLSDADNNERRPMREGGYVYLNFFDIPGGAFLSLDTIVEVERNCYTDWYSKANWNAQGDPSVQAVHTCSGVSLASPLPTADVSFSALSLSARNWTFGEKTQITVAPNPTGSVLPACTSSSPRLLSLTQQSDGHTAVFTVQQSAVLQDTTVSVVCGTKSENIYLAVGPTKARIDPSEVTVAQDNKSNSVLNILVRHPVREAGPGRTVDYWVGAVLPGAAPSKDELFFRTLSSSSQYLWSAPLTNSWDSMTFMKNQPLTGTGKFLSVPLDFKRAELSEFGVTIHLAYRINGGPLEIIDYYWDPRK